LRIYLFALVGMCLGSITGRIFYVLKDTRTLALLGISEALAYIVYAPFFARHLGIRGIALACVLFFNFSLFLHLLVIRYKTGKTGGYTVINSCTRTFIAAILGGAGALGGALIHQIEWIQLLSGGTCGLVMYGAALRVLGSAEAGMIWRALWLKKEKKLSI